MPEWEAPAKLNLTLLVRPPEEGYHPIRSLVQTVELCDLLRADTSDEDVLDLEGADLPTDSRNLVWKAVEALRGPAGSPRLGFHLIKAIPVAAGLAGGSSDAAAALAATGELLGLPDERVRAVAPEVGADVPFLLTGGTAVMAGRGDLIEPADASSGFAVAIAVPTFELSTAEVYRRWDQLEGPADRGIGPGGLPPALRREAPLRNDLVPAARSLRPELADWVSDLSASWGRPVAMSGSGPAHFGYFADLDEASDAAAAVDVETRFTAGVSLRGEGVRRVHR